MIRIRSGQPQKTVVIKNTEPSDIPTKLPDIPAAGSQKESAKEEPKAEPAKAPQPKTGPAVPQKTAKLRYQVPPLDKASFT